MVFIPPLAHFETPITTIKSKNQPLLFSFEGMSSNFPVDTVTPDLGTQQADTLLLVLPWGTGAKPQSWTGLGTEQEKGTSGSVKLALTWADFWPQCHPRQLWALKRRLWNSARLEHLQSFYSYTWVNLFHEWHDLMIRPAPDSIRGISLETAKLNSPGSLRQNNS